MVTTLMTTKGQLFKRINNALLDMQASTSQNFDQHFLTFARLLADSTLQAFNQKLVANLDVEHFLNESTKTQGSLVGSARLVWPSDALEVLGLKWLLIQKYAREPDQLFVFAHTFYTASGNVNATLHSLTRQLLIPFVRDYKDFVMPNDGSDGVGSGVLASNGEYPHGVQQQHITYNITGSNARVNHHSTDNSVNTVTMHSEVSNHIQALRNEIQRAQLTPDQKSEAEDVVEAIEAQIASGQPKKGVVSALIASLPAIQSITDIGKNLYDLLRTGGHI